MKRQTAEPDAKLIEELSMVRELHQTAMENLRVAENHIESLERQLAEAELYITELESRSVSDEVLRVRHEFSIQIQSLEEKIMIGVEEKRRLQIKITEL